MLQDGLRSAWAELKAQHPTETVYAFGLYAEDELLTFDSIAMTEEGLTREINRDESLRSVLRWSMGNSHFDGLGNEAHRRADDWATKKFWGPWHFTDAARPRRQKAIVAARRGA